ncbi:hypothetical protein [Microbacterium murale]|uniref:Helix-turn-helix domain-containing protein n=1 Tax=Microbacterium murale TaxID=1081040 RepID=A0ABU0PE92_9MICO|nr:hypothetical protein [Microbacterium murale]MDQ0645651.1 hypothetical protein [Microbacterium murale]
MTEAVHTLEEAAEILRVPYRTLRDGVYAGRWPHRKISERKRLMTDEDIQAVLDLTATQPSPTANPSEFAARTTKANVLALMDG